MMEEGERVVFPPVIDAAVAAGLRQRLAERYAGGERELELDLSDVESLTAEGCEVLVAVARTPGLRATVRALSDEAAAVLRELDLDSAVSGLLAEGAAPAEAEEDEFGLGFTGVPAADLPGLARDGEGADAPEEEAEEDEFDLGFTPVPAGDLPGLAGESDAEEAE